MFFIDYEVHIQCCRLCLPGILSGCLTYQALTEALRRRYVKSSSGQVFDAQETHQPTRVELPLSFTVIHQALTSTGDRRATKLIIPSYSEQSSSVRYERELSPRRLQQVNGERHSTKYRDEVLKTPSSPRVHQPSLEKCQQATRRESQRSSRRRSNKDQSPTRPEQPHISPKWAWKRTKADGRYGQLELLSRKVILPKKEPADVKESSGFRYTYPHKGFRWQIGRFVEVRGLGNHV